MKAHTHDRNLFDGMHQMLEITFFIFETGESFPYSVLWPRSCS